LIENLEAAKRIYIAGPMQGIPHFNFPRFNAVAAAFRSNGHTVFNPAEQDNERHGKDISADNASGSVADAKATHGFCLRTALAADLKFICESANLLVLLPGWEKSQGAQAEWRTALALKSEGMEIIYLTEEVTQLMERAAELMKEAA
jgi:hypothetical protein